MIIKVKDSEILNYYNIPSYDFPKYTTLILNLAVRFSQATRARNVGQMTDLIEEFSGNEFQSWVDWYSEKKPDAIEKATNITFDYIDNFREALSKIDKNLVREYIKDLVLNKTFSGLKFQKLILEKVSKHYNKSFSLSTPADESRGIDGFIDTIPVSIKPISYKFQDHITDTIDCKMIYYSKKKNNVEIIFEEIF